MIWVWIFAVPLAGAVAAGLVWLLRRRSAAGRKVWLLRRLASPVPPVPPAVEPEPVTDPLHPDWRPSGEIVEPLYFERLAAPAPWAWPSFTQAWPTVMPHNGSPTEGER